MLVWAGEVCVSPVAAELLSVWSSEESCCSRAVAAVEGETTERTGVSSLADWESVRIEGIKRECQTKIREVWAKSWQTFIETSRQLPENLSNLNLSEIYCGSIPNPCVLTCWTTLCHTSEYLSFCQCGMSSYSSVNIQYQLSVYFGDILYCTYIACQSILHMHVLKNLWM